MNRAQFLSLMAAAGVVIVAAPATVAPITPDGTIYIDGPGKWWIEMDVNGTLSACRVRRPGYCTVGFVVVE